MTMNNELLGTGIKKIRQYLGLKQKDLAKILDISGGYLSELECGKKNPGIDVLNKLVEKYQVNISYLFTGNGSFFIPTGKETLDETETNIKEISAGNELLEEMNWYIENIPLVRFALIEFFKSYLYDKRGLIEEEVEKFREKNKE